LLNNAEVTTLQALRLCILLYIQVVIIARITIPN